KLHKLAKKLRRQAMAAELKIEELMPQLKSIQKKTIEAPRVRFYRDITGIRTIIEEACETKNPWYFFGSSDEMIKAIGPNLLKEVVEDTDELRAKAGRPLWYGISDSGIKSVKPFNISNPSIRKIKILPKTLQPKSALMIYGNKLAVLSMSETCFGAVIENGEIADLLKMMYGMTWESLR
ncbi:MAG TPA: hypothetical protein VEA37_08230, partial [Flavobacterium sp.]|nr:hypothetical protein [Flavobacterium sp.]